VGFLRLEWPIDHRDSMNHIEVHLKEKIWAGAEKKSKPFSTARKVPGKPKTPPNKKKQPTNQQRRTFSGCKLCSRSGDKLRRGKLRMNLAGEGLAAGGGACK